MTRRPHKRGLTRLERAALILLLIWAILLGMCCAAAS